VTTLTAAVFLDQPDIQRLTGRERPSAQRRALDQMGVAYWVRPDGRPVVARSAVEGRESGAVAVEPNWAAI
jgi:hypothetical protein